MPDLDIGPPTPRSGISRWKHAERRYQWATWNSRPSVLIRHPARRIPVLLTAPHAGPTLRNGWPKPADAGTGGLAEALAELHGAGVITAMGVQPDDPNWDLPQGPFKQAVREELERSPTVLLDLHAMRRETEVDLCIGTGMAPDAVVLELAATIAKLAQQAGLSVTLNTPFGARSPGTITSFAQRLGHSALQIEINSRLLDLSGGAAEATAFLELMNAIVVAATDLAQRAEPPAA